MKIKPISVFSKRKVHIKFIQGYISRYIVHRLEIVRIIYQHVNHLHIYTYNHRFKIMHQCDTSCIIFGSWRIKLIFSIGPRSNLSLAELQIDYDGETYVVSDEIFSQKEANEYCVKYSKCKNETSAPEEPDATYFLTGWVRNLNYFPKLVFRW